MYRRLFFILPLLISCALAFYLGYALMRQAPITQPQELIGEEAPDFELPSLADSTKLIHLKDFTGQPVMINFFASWCAPCRQEHPLLMRLAEYKIPIIGIAYRDKVENAVQFLKALGNPYVAALNDGNGRVTISFGISGIPETFLINRKGQVVFRYAGPLDDTIIRHKILPRWEELQQK